MNGAAFSLLNPERAGVRYESSRRSLPDDLGNGDGSVGIIDQTRLPHAFETLTLTTLADAARAIKTMQVRGPP